MACRNYRNYVILIDNVEHNSQSDDVNSCCHRETDFSVKGSIKPIRLNSSVLTK